MNATEILNLLSTLEKRLATIADQAAETREQAQHTVDRLNRLRQDVEQLKGKLISSSETQTHLPVHRPADPA